MNHIKTFFQKTTIEKKLHHLVILYFLCERPTRPIGLKWLKISKVVIRRDCVGNKAKGRISKRVFQESKARQIFRKTNISYPLCAYQGVRNIRFSEIVACFVFLKHPFWDSSFWLITEDYNFLEDFRTLN